jgi:hypothetical protein
MFVTAREEQSAFVETGAHLADRDMHDALEAPNDGPACRTGNPAAAESWNAQIRR